MDRGVCVCVSERERERPYQGGGGGKVRPAGNQASTGVSLAPGPVSLSSWGTQRVPNPSTSHLAAACSVGSRRLPSQTYSQPQISLGETLPECTGINAGQKKKRKS